MLPLPQVALPEGLLDSQDYTFVIVKKYALLPSTTSTACLNLQHVHPDCPHSGHKLLDLASQTPNGSIVIMIG